MYTSEIGIARLEIESKTGVYHSSGLQSNSTEATDPSVSQSNQCTQTRTIIAEKRNVKVITERERIERVGGERGDERRRAEQRVEHKLRRVQRDKDGQEAIAVNVERERPLDVLVDGKSERRRRL